LENLPDELILELIPTEPRAFFNSVLKWLSKDHLSPELVKLTTERNSVKRFSRSFEEDSKICTSLIKARNVKNGYIIEAIDMKNRMASLDETVNQLAREIKDLAVVNSLLKEESKALLEENQLLKRPLLLCQQILKPCLTQTLQPNVPP
jgi:arsenate reductase-like glutaredoxin family protein